MISEESAATAPPATPGCTFSLGFNLAKVEGEGEDADPILRSGRDLGLAGVLDGMGGAGGTVYDTPEGKRTGAWLASRVARDVVQQRMLELMDPDWDLDGPAAAEDLREHVERALAARLAELKAPPSGLRSRLLRNLPTTLALVALQRTVPDGPGWTLHVLWAGDSRAYVLDAGGLHQLTRDDIRDRGDALENLRQDSVVSNAMSADGGFVVRHHQVTLEAPFVVVAATDGCFGYVPTPMHVEALLLSTLAGADAPGAWSAALQERIAAVTGDDAAMALLAVGAGFGEVRDLLAGRGREVAGTWTAPVDADAGEVGRLERELDEARGRARQRTAELWAGYREGYERLLAPVAGPVAEPAGRR